MKEATFIQMARKGRDAETCREVHGDTEKCRDEGRYRKMQWVVPHPQWWIKIWRDTSGVRHPSLTLDHPVQASSTRKISPHKFWL